MISFGGFKMCNIFESRLSLCYFALVVTIFFLIGKCRENERDKKKCALMV